MRRHLDPEEWVYERREIFALYKALSIHDQDERHRLQHALTGCSSLRLMTGEEHRKLIGALERIAQQPATKQARMFGGLLALSSFDYPDDGHT